MGRGLNRLRRLAADLRTRRRFRFEGFWCEVPDGVVNPSRFAASRVFARAVREAAPPAPVDMLELGCGSGLALLLPAAAGHRVTAVDIDPAAVQATRANLARNGLQGAVHRSDWDACLGDARYDYVVCNPPFMPERPTQLTTAFYAGPDLVFARAALAAMAARLRPGGRGLLLTSSLSGRDRVCAVVRDAGLVHLKTHTVRDWNEVYYVDLLAQAGG